MAHNTSGDAGQKRWTWQQGLGVFGLILAFGCLAGIGWMAWHFRNYEPFTARDYYPSRPDSYEVSFIEGNADITLPPSAHQIYVYSTGFQEIFTQVRFSMSASELDEFIKHTLCQGSLEQIKPPEPSTSDGTSDWWTPDQARELKACSGNKDRSHQTIMIDVTNPGIYIVFVSTGTQ